VGFKRLPRFGAAQHVDPGALVEHAFQRNLDDIRFGAQRHAADQAGLERLIAQKATAGALAAWLAVVGRGQQQAHLLRADCQQRLLQAQHRAFAAAALKQFGDRLRLLGALVLELHLLHALQGVFQPGARVEARIGHHQRIQLGRQQRAQGCQRRRDAGQQQPAAGLRLPGGLDALGDIAQEGVALNVAADRHGGQGLDLAHLAQEDLAQPRGFGVQLHHQRAGELRQQDHQRAQERLAGDYQPVGDRGGQGKGAPEALALAAQHGQAFGWLAGVLQPGADARGILPPLVAVFLRVLVELALLLGLGQQRDKTLQRGRAIAQVEIQAENRRLVAAQPGDGLQVGKVEIVVRVESVHLMLRSKSFPPVYVDESYHD
jgi:hypothetical protein